MDLSVCNLCQLQVPTPQTVTADMPLYTPQVDTLKLTPRKLCKPCHLLISQIGQFSSHYQIKYCDSHFKSTAVEGLKGVIPQARQPIQLIFSSQPNTIHRSRANTDNKSKLPSKRFSQGQHMPSEQQQQQTIHPYISLMVQEVKSKNMLCLSYLPKTLQLLIYISNQQSPKNVVVSPEERKEKIKNVILYLSQRIHLNLQELPYVLVLLNFLFCLMDPNKATSLITKLSDIMVAFPHLITWKTLLLEQEISEYKNPYSPASVDLKTVILKVDKIWPRIETILELAKRGESVLHEGMIRISKIASNDYKEYRKRLSEVLKPLLVKKQDKQDLKPQKLSQLYLLKLERNSFSLIVKNLIEAEEQMKQELLQLSQRHKKEKEEYVEKIIRLSNRIEELEQKNKTLKDERRVVSEFKASEDEQYIPVVQVEVQEGITSTKSIIEGFNQSGSKTQGQDLHVKLQSILTISNIIAFNQEHLGVLTKKEPNFLDPEEVTKTLIKEIQKLQESYLKVLARAKHAQDQKNRLLGIVSRKDDRFISVITEKDITIQRYEQALWRMENGLEVDQQPLAHRIRYIMHIFGKKKSAEESQSGSERDSKQQERHSKKESKDCDIY